MATTTELTDWYNQKNAQAAPATGLLNSATASSPTSVAPAVYTAGQVTPSSYTDTKQGPANQWNVGTNETVAGNVNAITQSGSPLMQSAATAGKQYAQSRGLLSSSLGAEASQKAMIESALPMAQADAATYSRAAGYNVDTRNKIDAANVASENVAKSFGAQAANRANEVNTLASDTASTFGAQALNRASEFNATNEYNKQQSLFEANVKASLDQINNEAGFDKQAQAVYGTLSSDFQKAMLAINTDTNMNQQSKDYSIMQMFNAYKAQISMLSAIGAVPDVSQLLIATP